MKRFHISVSISAAALILLLLALFSGKYSVESRLPSSSKAVRDLQINKDMKEESLKGEKDSFRRIPRTGSSPIQNKNGPLRGSTKQHITSREP
ncbi:unnamed protein product [Cochlearia groenlandica]